MITVNGKRKALINLYSSLIRKGSYVIDQVPEDMREEVQEKVDKLGPLPIDSTMIPADE